MFGGFVTTPDRIEDLLREAGFVDVRTLPSPPNAVAATVAPRRRDGGTDGACPIENAIG
jgi:hypothetical protein